jgi:Flp pilus assembly protein TadD
MKPTFLDARINLGGAYYTAGNKDKAWENFSAVLTLDSCNADAHYNLGVLLVEEGDGANAERAFTNAIACDPSYAKAFHNLGVLSATRDSIKSLTLFRTAARLGFLDSQVLLRKRGVPW